MKPLHDDFMDMLEAMLGEGVEFVVVGGYAMGLHGKPRPTGDLDLFVRASPENAARVVGALRRFGAPLAAMGVGCEDFQRPKMVVQIGRPPVRIDLITGIDGVTFDEAWESSERGALGGLSVPYLGRAQLLRNKRASGRIKDLADVEALESDDV